MEDTLRVRICSCMVDQHIVLILVLMEDTLRVNNYNYAAIQWVLILVLMEDTLRVYLRTCSTLLFLVLILVLMEDTLRGRCSAEKLGTYKS